MIKKQIEQKGQQAIGITQPDSGITHMLNLPPLSQEGRATRRVKCVFSYILWCILALGCITIMYWLIAADRYVSEATVVIQNTETSASNIDLLTFLSGGSSANKTDQLMLLEHLQSVDMLQKLDAKHDLRSHYNGSWDIISRMWFRDYSMEWFHRHYLNRTQIAFDDYSGVLRIKAEAYDAQTAHAITTMLVQEGERYMNELSHTLVRTQVDFLEKQVATSYDNVLKASKTLLDYQNLHKLALPESTVASIYTIIGKLEGQRTEIETQMAALPRSLGKNHPTIKSMQQALDAVERQIVEEHAKLASTSGGTLNSIVEEQKRLQLELTFATDIYKSSLVGLEKGRMDAARTIKVVSILQSPTFPQYPWQPRRIYNIISTTCITLLIIGITMLLRDIILDHID